MEEDFFKESSLFNDLYFLTKGKEECAPSHSYGPTMREFYIIHFVEKGEGIFEKNDIRFSLKKGNFFVIRPGEVTFYQADHKNPWHYTWFGINGESVEDLLNTIGISNEFPVGYLYDPQTSFSIIEEILSLNPHDNLLQLRLQGLLYIIFSKMIQNESVHQINENMGSVNKHIVYTNQVINMITENYTNVDFKIKDVADELAITHSYLTQVFKSVTTKTMHEYLMDFRIQKSRELLETTDESIAIVGEYIGYENSLSFTRSFKKVMGMTPREYKKRHKERMQKN